MWTVFEDTSEGYEAVVLSKSDYYPFGMIMPERHTESMDYRYAYNGMETDPEVKGNGNSYTTEFRQYDPRLGRWKSLDPLKGKYPWMSPYVAFNNNPVFFVDPLGLEGDPRIYYNPNGGKGNLLILIYDPDYRHPITGKRDFGIEAYVNITKNKLMTTTSFDVILASSIDFANKLVDQYLR